MLLLLPVLPCACNMVPGEEYAKCQRELLASQDEVRKAQNEVAARDQTIQLLKSQVAQVRQVDPKDLSLLIVPVKIELERMSGGYDEDDQPGHDGLVLYVQPIDRNGDVVKAAGSITVTLLDLANPPQRYVLGEYSFDANKTRELWYGKMWTQHFTVRCPWYPGQSPAHPDITARVEFHELLTGQTLRAQGVYRVDLPAGRTARALQ